MATQKTLTNLENKTEHFILLTKSYHQQEIKGLWIDGFLAHYYYHLQKT